MTAPVNRLVSTLAYDSTPLLDEEFDRLEVSPRPVLVSNRPYEEIETWDEQFDNTDKEPL